jgi:hypothetical protein
VNALAGLIVAVVVFLVLTRRRPPFVVDVARDRRIRAELDRYARALRLKIGNRGDQYTIEGVIGRAYVTIHPELSPPHDKPTAFDVQIVPAPQIPSTLMIFRRSGSLLLDALRRSVHTGDIEFDALAIVHGRQLEVTALLDSETRNALMAAIRETNAQIVSGDVSCRIDPRDGSIVPPERLSAVVAQLSLLAATLAQNLGAQQLPARIARVARTDFVPEVRRRALSLLVEELDYWEHTGETCRAALEDRDPGVRLIAAINSGEDGGPHLRAIAAVKTIEGSIRAQAIHHLGRTIPGGAAEVIGRALVDEDEEVQLAALEALTHVPAPLLPLPRLLDAIKSESTTLVAGAARLLGKARDLRAERPLIALLDREEIDIKLAAIWALGELGTIRAIEHLVPFARGSRLLEARLRRAAEDAIGDIQTRLGKRERGGLSMVATEDARGALSIDDQPGRLSFGDHRDRSDPTGETSD